MKPNRKDSLLTTSARLAAALLLAVACSQVTAQVFPAKSVRIVVPFPPGGATDIVGRTVAQKLSAAWGQPVLVDNRAGANGNIGTELVAKAAADGYTLLIAPTSFLTNPLIYKAPGYRPRDFIPITVLANVPNVVVVNPVVPARSMKELIDLARGKPDSLSYASSGAGSTQHLSGEMLKSIAKVDILHVPYKGSGPALTDLVGGQVTMMITAIPAAIPFIKSGHLRALAVANSRRSSSMPDVPTSAESGLAGFEVGNWIGLFAPAGTPQAVVDAIHRQFADILRSAEFLAGLEKIGAEPLPLTQTEFSSFIAQELPRYQAVTQSFGKLD
jgi:tripartite-type tricarboxylate transporter receptor subunit TctC